MVKTMGLDPMIDGSNPSTSSTFSLKGITLENLNGIFYGMLPIWFCLVCMSYIGVLKNCVDNPKKMFQYLFMYIGTCQMVIECTHELYEYPSIYIYVFFISTIILYCYMWKLGKKLSISNVKETTKGK